MLDGYRQYYSLSVHTMKKTETISDASNYELDRSLTKDKN